MGKKLTNKNKQFIRDNYLQMDVSGIAEAIGFSYTCVRRYQHEVGCVAPAALRTKWKGERISNAQNTATQQELDYIKANYIKLPQKRMAAELNRSFCFVANCQKRLGLKVPDDIVSKHLKSEQFKKGLNPWNAGRKGIRVSPKSEYKKGNKPANTAYDGAITIRNDWDDRMGVRRQYKYIRMSKSNWKLYHRHVWEQHNGPIPKRHAVRFIDGDTLNCDISNLECISLSENMRRNTNRKKAYEVRKIRHADGDFEYPSVSLTDNYVASVIADGNKDMKQTIIKNHPELIALKRKQIQLNRTIKQQLK